MKNFKFFASLIFAAAIGAVLFADDSVEITKFSLKDGTKVAAVVYVPTNATGKVAAELTLSPYKRTRIAKHMNKKNYDKIGFANVGVDWRGTGNSEGKFDPYGPDFPVDAGDVVDNVVAAQPWCNGKVFMVGGSFPAATQFAAMRAGAKKLVACAPSVMTLDPYSLYFSNGVRVDIFKSGWHIKFAGQKAYDELASYTDPDDPFWTSRADLGKLDECKASVFYQGGWFDMMGAETMSTYNTLRRNGRRVFLRQGPWAHGVNVFSGDINYKMLGGRVTEDLELDFLHKIVRGEKPSTDSMPGQILLYVMGRNEWCFVDAWPVSGTLPTDWNFGEGAKSFKHDPKNPVPSCGGRLTPGGGQMEQSKIAARKDVISFEGETLTDDLDIIGDVYAKVVLSSTASSADVAIKLIDVYPDGKAYNVVDSICRAKDLKPGEKRVLEFKVDSTAYRFFKGHKLRVDIAGSSARHYEVNPAAGETTIYADGSKFILPVIPSGNKNVIPMK
ncbi:MAG: CocE/NonD family hydrolase [Kiritimatiellae bacterium]|nr:CocE/NonD family hydrolase [Kiritimatiellia bacterium]